MLKKIGEEFSDQEEKIETKKARISRMSSEATIKEILTQMDFQQVYTDSEC